LARAGIDGKFGLIDLTGRWVVSAQFEQVPSITPQLAVVKAGGLFGIVNHQGAWIQQPIFEKVFEWHEGVSVVIRAKFCGLIDETGRILLEPKYRAIYDMVGGLSAFETESGAGFLDRHGEVAIPPTYESANDFSEGFARVRVKGKYGYIDQSGHLVIEARWDDGNVHQYSHEPDDTLFREGLAVVGRLAAGQHHPQLGYINAQGEVVIEPQLETARPMSEGLAMARKNYKFGFLDAQGHWVIAPQFRGARIFSDGLACVATEALWGFIDRSGQWAIPPAFAQATAFQDAVAVVQLSATTKYGVIDRHGKWILPAEYDTITSYKNGFCEVKQQVVDEDGSRTRLAQINSGLEPLLTQLANTILPFVRIVPVPLSQYPLIGENGWPKLLAERGIDLTLQSHFGGLPYIAAEEHYPLTAQGEPFFPLAQIRLEDIPPIDPLPRSGLLQFFIHWEKKQCLVRHIAAPRTIDPTSYLEKLAVLNAFDPLGDHPIKFPHLLNFSEASAPMSEFDYRFPEAAGKKLTRILSQQELLSQGYCALAEGPGSKLGGYPYFTQEDPRGQAKQRSKSEKATAASPYDFLLLQVDSLEPGILWGDMGVGNFFIAQDRLAKLDFSQVLFTWDCL
jgi:uncharacterized protein YwqG